MLLPVGGLPAPLGGVARRGALARDRAGQNQLHRLLEGHVHRRQAGTRQEQRIAADLVAERQVHRNRVIDRQLEGQAAEILARDEADQLEFLVRQPDQHDLPHGRLVVGAEVGHEVLDR